MKNVWFCFLAWGCIVSATSGLAAQQPPEAAGPVHLQVDNLATPLGIDDPAPKFSWQLRDPKRGAKQSAYEVLVASSSEMLQQGKADVWDSARVESSQSIGVPYAGPTLQPSTRYFWCVKVWGASGSPYTMSETGWWETGLMTQDAWHAQWIGYETREEAAVRHAPSEWIANPDAKTPAVGNEPEQRFDYRTTITLPQPVRFAALFATGQDTVSAWVNGVQVLTEDPLPPWKQMPWKKFVRADVTSKLGSGTNTVAIETLHYVVNPNGMATDDAPPMIATLFVQYQDGSWVSFASNPEWKTAIHAADGWQNSKFDDAGWQSAIAWQPISGRRSDVLGNPWIPDSVKALRHSFTVDKPVKSARLYATALGEYQFFVNQWHRGDQILAPGWTDYRERVVYQTYDVTDWIVEGKNAISISLAPGWYETPLEWFQQPNNYGMTPPAVRAQLRIEHTDGSVEWVVTDANWQATNSYLLHAELYDGDTMNPGDYPIGASSPDFNDDWIHERAIVIHPAPTEIVAQDFPPIRVERELKPVSLTEPKPGIYVYDFGQNFSGAEKMSLPTPREGGKFQIQFAEVLNPDGTIYTDNLRTAKARDTFSLYGYGGGVQARGTQGFDAPFTFHGFRYAEVTGLKEAPKKDALTGLVYHTDAPFTTKLETGSPLIDQLWSNILWGQRSNFVGIPTDCPQRDERLGWMGDAQVFWRTASYNMDLAAFSRKFAADMRGTQVGSPFYGIFAPGTVRPHEESAAGWSDAGVIVPWTSWLQTGDTTIIEQNWDAMEKYLNAILAENPSYLWKNDYGEPFGDWLSPEGKTNEVLIATAYWAWDVTLMRQMAHATGRAQDEEHYAQLFDEIRAAFQKQFVQDDGFIAGADNSASVFGVINNPNAKSTGGDTQTGYVLALHMNLLPENLRAAAARRLVDKIHANHDLLGTGFLGTPYLLEELTKAGYVQLAYTLLLNTRYPSWGYMVDHGATTMWERWNGDQMRNDPSMNSYNHYAYGAVADWIYRYAAGIDAMPLDAGFHTVVLHPVFDERLGHIAFDYDSAYGPIHSDWTLKNGAAEWRVTIPANTSGWLPLATEQAAKYKLDGTPLTESKEAIVTSFGGQNGFKLAAGNYIFEVQSETSTQ